MDWDDLNIEDSLFRYRSFDNEGMNIDALKNSRLYFSSPAWFNDPYDSLVFARADKIWREMARNITRGMDRYIEETKLQDPVEAFYGYHFWNKDKKKALQHTFELFHTGLKCSCTVRKQATENKR